MRHRRQHAQSMVEFALIAPIFFILLLGIVDFGRAIYFYNGIASGARQAARYAVVRDNLAQNDIALRQQARLDLFSMTVDTCSQVNGDVCATPAPSSATPNVTYVAVSPQWDQRQAYQNVAGVPGQTTNYPLTVTLTFYFRPATPIIAQLVGNQITLQASSTMITEY
jgi:Flp pilus assembly protein TadG